MKEPFANLELNFLVHCFQHINIDRSILQICKENKWKCFVAKKSSILMCIELHILELKKKDNCPNKEIAFKICGEKKSYFE